MASLTAGAINAIFNGEKLENVVLQVLDVLRFPTSRRYRLLLSDGVHRNGSVILSTRLNYLVECREISKFCVIRLSRYICNKVEHQIQMILIFRLEILQCAEIVGSVIGNPLLYKPHFSATEVAALETGAGGLGNSTPVAEIATTVADETPPLDERASASTSVEEATITREETDNSSLPSTPAEGEGEHGSTGLPRGFPAIVPIQQLTHRTCLWTIRARVAVKSPVNYYVNDKGPGMMFFLELLDESGEIRAVAFNEQCQKFHSVLQVNRVYYISFGWVGLVREQYQRGTHSYEIKFNFSTEVVHCLDENCVPQIPFDFVPIDELKECALDEVARQTGERLDKRSLTLMDDSNSEVQLTLWQATARDFDLPHQNAIIAVRKAKLNEYNGGPCLSFTSSSTMLVNPDILEAGLLKTWWQNRLAPPAEGCSFFNSSGSSNLGCSSSNLGCSSSNLGCSSSNLGRSSSNLGRSSSNLGRSSSDLGPSSSSSQQRRVSFGSRPLKTLREAKAGDGEFICKVVLTELNPDVLYKACLGARCEKKVEEVDGGLYSCGKCNKTMKGFNWRMKVAFNLLDFTDNRGFIVFGDRAESLLGFSAGDLAWIRDNNREQFLSAIMAPQFKDYVATIRTVTSPRKNISLEALTELDLMEHNWSLIDEIRRVSE